MIDSVLAWPLVVAGVLLVFRKPLSAFVAGLGGRVTRLSAFNISTALAALPPPPPWSEAQLPERLELTAGEVSRRALMTLFQTIGQKSPWDYLIVDSKDGRSRLVTVSEDRTARVWDLTAEHRLRPAPVLQSRDTAPLDSCKRRKLDADLRR